jgi:hypothetical protein
VLVTPDSEEAVKTLFVGAQRGVTGARNGDSGP